MDFKKIAKWAVILAVVFVGIQFSLAYVTRTQLKSIMESEALDARRTKLASEEQYIRLVGSRAQQSSLEMPEDMEIVTEGIEDDNADIVVYADYTQEVNLVVYVVRLKMSITARADAPDDPSE
jgi:uncharacterized protein YpmB